jgi:hypothetical protein
MMPRTSSRKIPKRPRAGPRSSTQSPSAGVGKVTAAKHKALRAAKVDPVLTQEFARPTGPIASRAAHPLSLQPAVEWLGFMSRAASASLSLPSAMMGCRTPLEMWNKQNKLLQSVFADFQEVSARVMAGAFNGPADAGDSKVKKRRQTVAS